MKIKQIFPLLVLCASTFASAAPVFMTNPVDPSLAGSSVVDFTGEAQGYFSSRTFGGGDVTVNTTGSDLNIENTYGGSYASSGNYLANGAGGNGFNIVFANAVSAFGFNWGAADRPWTMRLFDASNAMIGSFAVAAQTDPYAAFIGADGNGQTIKSINMVASSYDYMLLDNLQYTASNASVPEPTTLAMLGLGMLGLFGARRRK